MAEYRRSLRLCKKLNIAKKKTAKFEAVVQGSARKKLNLPLEFSNALRKIGQLEASCYSSLERENRLEQEISFCRDRTCNLEAQFQSRGSKVSNLETTLQSLKNKKEDLHRELLKTQKKSADLETALESMQRERVSLCNGDAQLNWKIIEYEKRIEKLESDKKFLEAELLKLREIISTLEGQIDALAQDKTGLFSELEKAKNGAGESNCDSTKFLRVLNLSENSTYGANREETTPNNHFIIETDKEKSADEIRRLHEVAADLETKYNTCRTELAKQEILIKTIVAREEAASRAARDVTRGIHESRVEIDKRDAMMKTLVKDKRSLEHYIQDFNRNCQQKCDSSDAEQVDEERALVERNSIRARVFNVKLQDSVENYQQTGKIISSEPNSEKNISSGYNSHKQKAVTSLHKGSKSVYNDYAKHDTGIFDNLKASESLRRDHNETEKDIFRGHLSKKKQEELIEARVRRQFHASVKSANEIASVAWSEQCADYESKYRGSCHEHSPLKTSFTAVKERIPPQAKMENDLDEGSAEYSNKFEKHRLDVEEDRLENEMGVTDCEQVPSSIIDFELPDSTDSVEVHPIESNAESGKRRGKLEKIELDVERDLLENKSGVTEDFSLATEDQGSEQVQSSILVSNGDAMASSSTESEFTNGHVSPVLNKNENGSTTSSDQEASDLSSFTTRKEELEQLCEVLMEERDKATGSLRERDDEVFRLRMRAVETEHEKSDLRNQLAKVQSHSELLEKDLTSSKEENERLRAEIERLRKRIEELEAENSDLRIKFRARDEHDHADGKKTTSDSESAESAPLKAVEESVYVPSKEEDDKKHQEQEHPAIADEITTGDEVQSTEVIKSDAITESAPAASEVTVKRRETRRTSPNYYRHSFAGSLPRPFHSFELHSQHSFDHSSKHERSESVHSDTSGESEPDTQAPPSIPSFMRRRLDKPYLKSGFSPVQFNYQPLPESISNRRGSWLEGVKVRSGSLTRAHENSSDSESSGVSGTNVSASVEEPRECEREQVASTLNSAPEEIDGVYGSGNASETEKYGRSFKLHSQPPEYAENASESKHSTDEGRQSETKVVQENGEAHEEEKEKSENVSDLVDLWNSRTEVYDI